MSRASSKPTDTAAAFDARWKAFHAETMAVETPPKGAITAPTYAKLNGVTLNVAAANLRRLATENKLKTGMFRVMMGSKIQSARHYWQ